MNMMAAALLALFLFTQLAFNEKKERVTPQWHAPSLPDKLDFSGEAVPLDRWDVQERLDREVMLNFSVDGKESVS